jgi:hypothetical protein
MSQKKIKAPHVGGKKRKTVTIGIEEDKNGRRFTSVNPHGPITPPEMIDGLLDALAAVYLNVWGAGGRGGDGTGTMTPEQFCELAATKILARLAGATVGQSATVQ